MVSDPFEVFERPDVVFFNTIEEPQAIPSDIRDGDVGRSGKGPVLLEDGSVVAPATPAPVFRLFEMRADVATVPCHIPKILLNEATVFGLRREVVPRCEGMSDALLRIRLARFFESVCDDQDKEETGKQKV